MKLGRNEPCHCGSGKKYKNCHEAKKQSQKSQYYIIGVIAIVIIAAISINTGDSNSNQNSPVSSNSSINNKPTSSNSKPSGATPPGKVWSDEHGHWHDEPGSKSLAPKKLNKTEGTKITIPPMDKDNPPDGKIWNEQHGHFHDKE